MNKNNGLSENKMALFNIASTILVAGINFITIPIFTRMLDTDGYGLVNIYIAWVQIFTVFVGLKADGSIGSAKANLANDEQDSYQFSILMLSLCAFSIVLIGVLFFLHPLSDLLNMSPVLTVCMVLQSFGAFVISVFNMRFIFKKQAQKNFLVSVGLCVSTTVLSIVLIMFVFSGADGYLGRTFGLMAPNVLIASTLVVFMIVRLRPTFNVSYWRFCLIITVPLIFHGLSQLLLAQTGKIVVQQVYGDSLAGIYSIAVVVVSLMGAIYSALNNAFVPFMYDDLAGKTTVEKKQSHFKNYLTLFTMGTCAFAMMSPELLKVMSTESFWSATEVLPYLILGQYCVFLYSFPVNYEFFKMKTRSIAVGTIFAALINIFLTVALVPMMGITGAAISTMISYIALFLFHFCIARYFLGDRNYSAKYYFAGLVLAAAFCFGYFALKDAVLVRWCIGAVMLLVAVGRIVKTKSIF